MMVTLFIESKPRTHMVLSIILFGKPLATVEWEFFS